MDRAELDALLQSYDDSVYPEAFLEQYTPMACLADRNGITTFLVQNRKGERLVARCCDRERSAGLNSLSLLRGLSHPGLPRCLDAMENGRMTVALREYVEGVPLDLYAAENELSEREITDICIRLCDILGFLHHRDEPIIHRDIKPQNVIVRPDGSLVLIDFDIARVYRAESETDTTFFGTVGYAPPEQYGFSQTDVRADIYSLGVLLRWLLTGSTRENKNVRVYRPLEKIIARCTAFSPNDTQFIRLDTAVYAAVKAHDPTLIADWSSLKEDTGQYPGERVAMDFAEKTGITTGANRPFDISVGELALVFANTDRVFDAAAAQ